MNSDGLAIAQHAFQHVFGRLDRALIGDRGEALVANVEHVEHDVVAARVHIGAQNIEFGRGE